MIMLRAGDAVEYPVSFEKIIKGGEQHIPIFVSDDIRGDGGVVGGIKCMRDESWYESRRLET